MAIKNIAIIGFGSAGKRHLRLIKQKYPDTNIFLLSSSYSLEASSEKHINKVYKNLKDLLKNSIDCAFIANPAPFHLKYAIAFLKKKIPIFIEKPISDNLKKIDKFLEIKEKAKVPTLVGYVLRHSQGLMQFKKLLDQKKIGSILSVNVCFRSFLPSWREGIDYKDSVSASSKLGGGVLLELSHEIDYANLLFGPFDNVNANIIYSDLLDIDVEDEVLVSLKSKKNYNVDINLCFSEKNIQRFCVAKGSDGTLIWNILENKIILQQSLIKKDIWEFDKSYDRMFETQLDYFFNLIERNEIKKNLLDESIQVLKLISHIKKSHDLKKIIEIKD